MDQDKDKYFDRYEKDFRIYLRKMELDFNGKVNGELFEIGGYTVPVPLLVTFFAAGQANVANLMASEFELDLE